jgi:Tol biopolymer transport system component
MDIVSPRLSPDGRTIALAGVSVPGSAATPGDLPGRLFAWLRDLVVSPASAHGLAYELWLVDVDGANLRRVGDLVLDDPFLRWSADGRHLYVYDGDGLAIVDVATAQATMIFEPGSLGGFDWLPRR